MSPFQSPCNQNSVIWKQDLNHLIMVLVRNKFNTELSSITQVKLKILFLQIPNPLVLLTIFSNFLTAVFGQIQTGHPLSYNYCSFYIYHLINFQKLFLIHQICFQTFIKPSLKKWVYSHNTTKKSGWPNQFLINNFII